MRLATILAAAFWAAPIAASVWAFVSLCCQAKRRDSRAQRHAAALQAAFDEAAAEADAGRVADEFIAWVDDAIALAASQISDADREFARQNGVLL